MKKELGRAPSPHLDEIQKKSNFFRETFPNPQIRKIRQKGVGGYPHTKQTHYVVFDGFPSGAHAFHHLAFEG